jgi:hypothetical protein
VSQGPENQYGGDASFDRIDADAVCEECGTVNPEGTLFCKTCGNNLRDQRAHRMTTEGPSDLQDTPAQTTRRVLVGLLTVLAFLLLIWAAMPGNVERLTERLTTTMAEDVYGDGTDPRLYWDGQLSDLFDAMAADLRANPVTSEEIRQADETPAVAQGGDFGGKYFLRRGARPDDPVLGSALVVEDNGALYFVAFLGEMELRGRGDFESTRYPSSRFVGVRLDERYSSAHGYAQPLDEGGFLVVGQRDNSNFSREINAYRVP